MDDRPDIALGALGTAQLTVGPEHLASTLAGDADEAFPPVLATAMMIALMERAGARAMQHLLRAGELSVGYGVDVRHTAPTPPGARVEARATFVGREGRLYAFEVVATDEQGEIGRGRHLRAIVEVARLRAGAERRRAASGRNG